LANLAPQYLEELRQMYPGVPDDELPLAAGVSGQINALKKRLNEENQLDLLANERKNLITSGGTLFPDLTSYIKGRDTYIKDVDKMIEDVKDNMATGLSDPASIAANHSYLNYLSILKGRQNNRYIDLLNSAVTSHDNRMKTITESYNDALSNYNDALSSGKKITVDRYKQVYDDLSKLYTLVQSGPKLALDAELKKQQILKAQLDNVKSTKEISGETTENDIMKEAKTYQDKILETSGDGKGKFLTNVDLYSQAAAALASGKSPNSFIYIIQEGLANSVSSQELKNTKARIDKFIADGGESLLKAAGYSATDTEENEVPLASVFKSYLEFPTSKMYSSLINENIDGIKTILNYLIGIDPAKISNKKKDFDSKAAQLGIDNNLSEPLWNYYVNKALKQYGSSAATKDQRKSMFTILSSSADGVKDLAGALARNN
jgi:hypothetical protein